MLCQKCFGSGTVMGLGMMYEDCYCDDLETTEKKNVKSKPVQIDKRSASYREAIKKIMSENSMQREEATSLFESEFNKLA